MITKVIPLKKSLYKGENHTLDKTQTQTRLTNLRIICLSTKILFLVQVVLCESDSFFHPLRKNSISNFSQIAKNGIQIFDKITVRSSLRTRNQERQHLEKSYAHSIGDPPSIFNKRVTLDTQTKPVFPRFCYVTKIVRTKQGGR